MFDVIKSMEYIMIGTDERYMDEKNLVLHGRTAIDGKALSNYSHKEISYSGHNIAMLGLRKDVHYYQEGKSYAEEASGPTLGFKKLRCYSAYLIDMHLTYYRPENNNGNRILFPQRAIMEDIEFEHECVR